MPFLTLLALLGSIIFVNTTLSGENVLASSSLLARISPSRRWLVLALGGSGAILLRIVCTLFVASWFDSSLMQAIGGFLLLLMAIQLLRKQQRDRVRSPQKASVPSMTEIEDCEKQPGAATRLTHISQWFLGSKLPFLQKGILGGIVMMVVVDSTTSVDNIIAIGAIGAAHGANAPIPAFGLVLSMTMPFLMSTHLALLLHRLSWLTLAASLLLAIRAGGLLTTAVSSVFRMTSISLGQYRFPLQWLMCVCCFVVWYRRKR